MRNYHFVLPGNRDESRGPVGFRCQKHLSKNTKQKKREELQSDCTPHMIMIPSLRKPQANVTFNEGYTNLSYTVPIVYSIYNGYMCVCIPTYKKCYE